ncbi:hypothetical protein DYD21_04775 [Rhodohalobacter sp. SW132]|uniref:hypothetical protein n=1 Tax=Rhodohalobacter sp. SW132 TaxID=2293433 RepID=UPI000E21DD61|nr:hypothetical protein [Rhodohalobacter sp. SW132]REL37934.1 hypothetical protein DYD21_04775 [Rhodohalobacter sp. SW132]
MTKNPLKVIYTIISIPLGLIGLISLSQNIFLWKQFFVDFAAIYDAIVYPVFRLIPIDLHDRLKDYFFVGILCGFSFIMALDYGNKNELFKSHGNIKAVKAFYFFLYLFFWPLGLTISIAQSIGFAQNHAERKIKIMFFYWLLSILLIFIVIVVINYQL